MKTTVSTISEQGDSYLLWITEGFLPVINVKKRECEGLKGYHE